MKILDWLQVGLRVVALAGAGGLGRIGKFEFQMMLLVTHGVGGSWERDFVVGRSVTYGFAEKRSNVVVEVEGQAPALGRKNLKRKVSRASLPRFGNTLEKLLVKSGVRTKVRVAQRIDAVESDTRAAQCSGKTNNIVKELLLLFLPELHFRTGEQWPARRNPNDDLASGARGFSRDKLLQATQ